MQYRIYKLFLVFALLVSTVFLDSCEKDKIYPSYPVNVSEFYSIMDQWYYWKDSISDVNPANYSDPSDLLEAMRYTNRDKWSYITTKEENSQYYEEGTYVGYGFGYAPDASGNIRITFLFDDSDLNDYGIKRGWIIKKINGNSVDKDSDFNDLLGSDDIGVSNNIEFESPSGVIVNEVFEKKLIKMNTVINAQVIDKGAAKIGYFVFKSFIGPSNEELDDIFSYFKSEQVNQLVIDLRYNGGGRLDVVSHLAGLIIPDNVDGQVFVKYRFNDEMSNQNYSEYFEQDESSLRLNKVYFIAGKGSASASEVIINSLKPYIDVYIVGDDTYGKPVGMISFASKVSDLVYVPICFKLLNANDYGGYYDGLKADDYVEDDILNDFGEGEAILDEVLYHIEYGSFSSTKSSHDIYRAPVKEIRGIKDEIGAI